MLSLSLEPGNRVAKAQGSETPSRQTLGRVQGLGCSLCLFLINIFVVKFLFKQRREFSMLLEYIVHRMKLGQRHIFGIQRISFQIDVGGL